MRKYKYIFIIFFLTLLSAPSLFFMFYTNDFGFENRAKNPLPEFDSRRHNAYTYYLKQLREYYNDNFAFRDLLYRGYSYYKWDILQENLFPDKLVFGKDGWFFLGDLYEQEFHTSLGLYENYEEKMVQLCKEANEMKRFCESLNIGFYYAVVPNKSTFYSEYLPLIPNNKQRLIFEATDKLKQCQIDVVDLGEYMWDKKEENIFYYKTDSHWNEYGAFEGAAKLFNETGKKYPLEPLIRSDYFVDTILVYQMDLTKLINITSPENVYKFKHAAQFQKQHFELEFSGNSLSSFIYHKYINNEKKCKVLIFGDSFLFDMTVFLTDNIGELVIHNNFFHKELILKEKPDLVVFQAVERRLTYLEESTFIQHW